MLRSRLSFLLLASFLLSGSFERLFADDPVLVRVRTRKTVYVGELVKNDDKEITFLDLKSRRSMTVPMDDIVQFTNPATLDEASRSVGLPAVTAWKISHLLSRKNPVGKVAKVSPQVVYVTLGKTDGIILDANLIVYRKKSEIKDPETGDVLAIERPKIAELKVTEVNAKFSKAKITGDLEVTLEVGDEVEKSTGQARVAICPIYDEDGTLTNIGASMGEDITTRLVQRKVPVVERSVLNTVLPELLIQNTALFDSKTAQKLGKLAGASVVITGKIVPINKSGTAYIRMVDVESGKILLAASSSISLSQARKVGSTPTGSGSSKADVKLIDDAPANWMLSRMRRGLKIWRDKPYVIVSFPKEMSGGTILVRGIAHGQEWLPEHAVSVSQPVVVYAVMRWKRLGMTDLPEIVFTQFERDGWERLESSFKSTYPPGGDWQWAAFKMKLSAGEVLMPLKTVKWGNEVPVFFVFK